jgi:hypothetical protein
MKCLKSNQFFVANMTMKMKKIQETAFWETQNPYFINYGQKTQRPQIIFKIWVYRQKVDT